MSYILFGNPTFPGHSEPLQVLLPLSEILFTHLPGSSLLIIQDSAQVSPRLGRLPRCPSQRLQVHCLLSHPLFWYKCVFSKPVGSLGQGSSLVPPGWARSMCSLTTDIMNEWVNVKLFILWTWDAVPQLATRCRCPARDGLRLEKGDWILQTVAARLEAGSWKFLIVMRRWEETVGGIGASGNLGTNLSGFLL